MDVKRVRLPLFIIATFLFGIKTYVVYRFLFSMELDNKMQELILFINPFVSAFVIFSLSIWFKKPSRQTKFLRYTALVGTIIIFSNLVFYRNFTDFITLPQLFQGSNVADLGKSILTLIKGYDIFLFTDVALIWYISRKKQPSVQYQRSGKVFVFAMSLVLLAGNFLLAEIERPQLFTRAFDREYLVKNIGLFNYHIYDVVMHSKSKTQRVFADGNELSEITDYIDKYVRNKQQSDLFGVAEEKNIIFIWAESLQSFVINNKVNGKEITPFMNQLTKDKDTYYFENFYHQTEQGKTSDSEFLVANSLYPLSRGAVFFTHGQNKYHAIPEIIKQKGYHSVVFHGNNGSFWNRDQMYDSLHYDHFYDREAYEVTEENSIGWGIKDKPFFEQSVRHLQTLEQPFYAKLITLTNHFPFELDETDQSIKPYDSNSTTLNNYFPTVRYLDEAIEQFFTELKQSGLYYNSVIIIMGDHYGISANHYQAMSEYLDIEEITPYDHIQLQRVPFFIHVPGSGNGKVMSQVAGQIDVKPTILHMLGIETNNDIYFGNDLFYRERKGYIAFRNGDFVSDDYIYTGGVCYNRQTGEQLEELYDNRNTDNDQTDTACDSIKDKVDRELEYSDTIIYGDLFRFVDFK